MATCPRMPGTEWRGEQSAASGQRPPSTTCDCLSMFSNASWDLNALNYSLLLLLLSSG